MSAQAQEGAWEGLINAGRNALQQQNFSEAERRFEAALEEAERFPSGDARLGKSYNNLAAVYYAQEDYERAEPLMRRALDQLRESLGPESTDVAQTMKNLAALYYLQGDRDEAETLLKQSLSTFEAVHGPNHAYVATVLSNLAGLYQADNRYGDAEPLLTRSLGIWESLLGANHPDVARSRTLLAQVRQAQGGGQEQQVAAAEAADGGAAGGAEPIVPTAKPLTPLAANNAADDEGPANGNGTPGSREEIARAASALEALANQSKADAERADAGGVPVPALSPIRGLAGTDGESDVAGINAALTPGGNGEAGQDGAAASNAAPAGTPDPASLIAAVDGAGDAANGPETGEDLSDPSAGTIVSNDPSAGTIVNSALAAANGGPSALLGDVSSPRDVSFAVYLSTLWSVDEARRYWQALQAAMPEVLADKSLEIEPVASANGADPFYRVLTTPFSSDPEAAEACEQIRSKLRTHDCSVVVRDGEAAGSG